MPSESASGPPVGLTRRDVLAGATAGVAGLVLARPGAAHASALAAAAPGDAARIRAMAAAARKLLETLRPAHRRDATFAFGSAERGRWHWTVPEAVPRNGIPLSEMTKRERDATLDLVEASLSPRGFTKAKNIMSLQRWLNRDPLLYYVSVFGTPGSARWGWRFEGHHLSHHFTIARGTVVSTPYFLGAWPTRTPRGLRAMRTEEEAAREIVRGLDATTRAGVIFSADSLTDHVTGNAVRVRPLAPLGLELDDLGRQAQKLTGEILDAYLAVLPRAEATLMRAPIDKAGIGALRFGWSGSLTPGRPHYYRLQGATFLLEFDNSRNSGTHIHSVWRDYARDFGRNVTS
jgi:hypothetical protein